MVGINKDSYDHDNHKQESHKPTTRTAMTGLHDMTVRTNKVGHRTGLPKLQKK